MNPKSEAEVPPQVVEGSASGFGCRLSGEESSALDVLRFLCVLCIVPLHCSVAHRIPAPDNAIVFWMQKFLGIPSLNILFFISGFLFFNGTSGLDRFFPTWKDKLARRIHSLFVPYFAWSAVALLWYAVSCDFPEGHSLDHPLKLAMSLVGWSGWFSHPVGFALWYVKSLICFSVISPLYWCVFKMFGRASLVIAVFLVAFPPFPIDWPFFNSWLFFGACIAWNGTSLARLTHGFGKVLPLSLVSLFVWQVLVASGVASPRFLAFIPVLAWACTYDKLLAGRIPLILRRIAPAASFLYFAHVLVSKITLAVLLKFSPPPISQIGGTLLFLSRSAITLVLSLVLFFLLRSKTPKTLSILTGARC